MMTSREPSMPLIPQFYAGRSVFITGATGFLGKVLVERLLVTCPDIDRLYLLVRHKRDISPETRLQQLKQSEVFDVIRQCNPSQLDKLHILPGDITQPELGLNSDSLSKLNDVSVVFHCAATLKFDEALKLAVEQNVLSVIKLMDICDRLTNLEAFVYVSTAYSNADLSTVEERVYPPPAPLQEVLAVTRSVSKDVMSDITEKYIYPKPNTYTFTKAMAENVVQQHTDRSYPVAIFRPTIVISSMKHPFPGWVENLNGPTGFIVGTGKGLLHLFCCNHTVRADMIPVDIAIDTLIATAWEIAIDKPREVRVYNCSTYENPTTWREFEIAVRGNFNAYPLDNAYWHPSGQSFSNEYAQKLMEFTTQTLPLHSIEYTLRFFGVKTKMDLITMSNRLKAMNKVLKYFATREWRFVTDNVRRMRARLAPCDAAIYNIDPNSINWDEQCENFVRGIRKYLLKERDQDLDKAKQHYMRMLYLHNGVLLFVLAIFIRFALFAIFYVIHPYL